MQDIRQFLSTRSTRIRSSRQAYKFCFCFSRIFKLKMAEPSEDIVSLFEMYSDNGIMTAENLRKFLVDFQGEHKTTIDNAQSIVNSFKHLRVFQRRGLPLNAFFSYLLGEQNPPISLEVYHDMKAPLAHYFLYTGHNSYLTGNQLSSDSSIEPIINALRRGVRVIELDLWPNSEKDDVEVCHGGTLTSHVKLIKCLEAIKENAFYASEYPVIITFEDHLDPSLQKKVAHMVISTFGDMLFPGVDFLEFPSPESLKGKILISTKPPLESLDSLKEQEHDEENISYAADKLIPIFENDSEFRHKSGAYIHTKKNGEMEEEEDEAGVPEYRNLIAIHAKKLKGELEHLLKSDTKRVARLSMSEQKLQNAVKTHGTDIINFTKRNLLRVYPKGTRILSSNYDPLIGWTHGAQMVAFNMQGYGKYLSVMQGMFRANGGCGYVKKPDILLRDDDAFNPSTKREVKKILKVKVYMGEGWHLDFRPSHFDPLSPPDFFTKLEVLGVPSDRKKERTVPIEDEWSPIWNKEFEFPLTVPDLALLRIEVGEFDTTRRHDFGGQTCLPVSELRSGIRAVPLYNKKGEKYKHGKLLMQFQLIQAFCDIASQE